MLTAIQYLETFGSCEEATCSLEWLKGQVDYLGGRVLPPRLDYPFRKWRVQAFFEDVSVDLGRADSTWLPDGCRRVMIPDSQRQRLGIVRQPTMPVIQPGLMEL